jgi:hypothetical protein
VRALDVRLATARVAVARGFALRTALVAVLATVAREVVPALRGLARPDVRAVLPARAAWGVAYAVSSTGAIGSAKTARIDKNVEHTKNAPANKKTVLTAFFSDFATVSVFMNISPCVPRIPRIPTFYILRTAQYAFIIYLIISIFWWSVNNK